MHTISAEQLLKAYNGKYKYVTMDKGGQVDLFASKPILNESTFYWLPSIKIDPTSLSLGKIAITEFQGKDWTECIYKAKPSEEDMIGCIGWFWDEEDDEKDDGQHERHAIRQEGQKRKGPSSS